MVRALLYALDAGQMTLVKGEQQERLLHTAGVAKQKQIIAWSLVIEAKQNKTKNKTKNLGPFHF